MHYVEFIFLALFRCDQIFDIKIGLFDIKTIKINKYIY